MLSKFISKSHKTSQRYFSAKFFNSADEAIFDIQDNAVLAVGGFGLCGLPEFLIEALVKKGTKNLTCLSNNSGSSTFGIGKLLQKKQVGKMISSYVGDNDLFVEQYLDGTIELEFTPQGTLAEKMRSGAFGIPAFYTRAGLGTVIEEGGLVTKYNKDGTPQIISKPKPKATFNGIEYIQEETLRADFSIVKAHVADTLGNVIFNKSANNFNKDAAKCGRTCIVEVEEIVPAG
jgi:3-oxoacid CoA-transferase A subunit